MVWLLIAHLSGITKRESLTLLTYRKRNGEKMLKNIIDEIKAAEDTALKIRKKADADARAAVDGALKEAEKITVGAVLAAERAYGEKIEEAKKTAAGRIDENRKTAYENAAAMTEIANVKADTAVKFIIDSILGAEK